MYALIDIDNCIADDSHRLHLIDMSISDPDERYEAYHRMLHLDEAHNHHLFKIHCDDRIIFVTARPERYRQDTWHWLKLNFEFSDDTLLFMRPEGNHEPSEILKPWLIGCKGIINVKEVFCAYDDRQEVLDAYKAMGIVNVQRICIYEELPEDVPQILRSAAATFEQRNKLYGDSYLVYGEVMEALFPEGVTLATIDDWNRFGILSMIVSKLTRYSANMKDGGHKDSAHDMAVYAAMLEEQTK
jgi:hypothetical protein